MNPTNGDYVFLVIISSIWTRILVLEEQKFGDSWFRVVQMWEKNTQRNPTTRQQINFIYYAKTISYHQGIQLVILKWGKRRKPTHRVEKNEWIIWQSKDFFLFNLLHCLESCWRTFMNFQSCSYSWSLD